jgi:hypothetical protein
MGRGTLGIIWEAAAMPHPLLVADEVAALRAETAGQLQALGILRRGRTAGAVGCEACELDHLERVEPAAGPDGAERYFIRCPEQGRVEVSRERLQQWMVDFTPVAAAIRESLEASGELEMVRPGRLWRLGEAALAGRLHELWMIRGAFWSGGPEILPLTARRGIPVFFILGEAPAAGLASLDPRCAFDAAALVTLEAGGLRADADAVERQLRPAPRPRPRPRARLRLCARRPALAIQSLSLFPCPGAEA